MDHWKPRIPWLVAGTALAIALFALLGRSSGPAVLDGHTLDLYDDNGNGRITCAEARAHGIAPVPRSHPAYAYMRDGDNDGMVCES